MARLAKVELGLSDCEYRKDSKLLVVSSTLTSGFPNTVLVKSEKTGRVIEFEVDVQAGIDNEFWDGEMCEYVPVEPVLTVSRLVVSNFV